MGGLAIGDVVGMSEWRILKLRGGLLCYCTYVYSFFIVESAQFYGTDGDYLSVHMWNRWLGVDTPTSHSTTRYEMLTCISSAPGSLDLISLIGFTLDFTNCQSCFVKFAEPLLFRLPSSTPLVYDHDFRPSPTHNCIRQPPLNSGNPSIITHAPPALLQNALHFFLPPSQPLSIWPYIWPSYTPAFFFNSSLHLSLDLLEQLLQVLLGRAGGRPADAEALGLVGLGDHVEVDLGKKH